MGNVDKAQWLFEQRVLLYRRVKRALLTIIPHPED